MLNLRLHAQVSLRSLSGVSLWSLSASQLSELLLRLDGALITSSCFVSYPISVSTRIHE